MVLISDKIKEKRKLKGATIQGLANKANVSKGLISQIENGRTVPSLPVLMNIISSLDLNLNDFFNDIYKNEKNAKVKVKRLQDYDSFEKEHTKGFFYRRVMSVDIKTAPIDIVLIELKKGAKRSTMIKTEAYEYKYIIKGSVQYFVNNEAHRLDEGDSIFVDGRMGHRLVNIGDENALILVIYLFSAYKRI